MKNGTITIAKESALLNVPRLTYQKTAGMGKVRKETDPRIQLLIWAQQFVPLRFNGTNLFQSYCAYGGFSLPLSLSKRKDEKEDKKNAPVETEKDEERDPGEWRTGFAKVSGAVGMHVDHKVPNGQGGNDDSENMQGLSWQLNMSPMKGEKKTLHVMAECFRRGQTISGMNFEPRWELFMWCFDEYQRHDRVTTIEEMAWWPWWCRHARAPFRPFLPGYDEERHEMYLSPEESYNEEYAILAGNVCNYLRWCVDIRCKRMVIETFEKEYGKTPETMAAYKTNL